MKYKIITFFSIITLLGSCSHFEELNTDPASTTVGDAPSLLSAVQIRLSGERETTWRSTCYFHMAISQMVGDGWTISRGQVYELDYSYIAYMWEEYYQLIANVQEAIALSDTPEMVNYKASGMVMRALLFSHLTDTYGDIPYSEASKGYSEEILFPKYDTQEDIYNDLFIQLDEAAKLFDASQPLDGDLIYNGDVTLWRKFANSLRLRLAMRLINVDIDKAKTEALAAISGGVMNSYTESAYVNHELYDVNSSGTAEIRGNALSQVINYSEEIIFGCATYTDYLRDNNDPRFRMMFGIYGGESGTVTSRVDSKSSTSTSIEVSDEYEAKYGTLQGQPKGTFFFDDFSSVGIDWTTHYVTKDETVVQIDKIFKCLQIHRDLTGLDAPSLYLAYSEVELWLAEVALYGWYGGTTDMETHFSNAVEANMAYLSNIQGASEPSALSVQSYINYIWNSSDDKFMLINMQHYVCNFFNGMEGYANWRRSGYPQLESVQENKTDATLGGYIPRRMPYPLTEVNYNNTNLENSLNGASNFWGNPVWWDGDKTRGVILLN